MRSFSKNKFLLCFRPVVDMDAMLLESKVAHRSTTSHFSCIPTSHKHDVMKNSETKSLHFPHLSPKRTISRVVKAVFFETILHRRSHHKNRYIQDSFGYKPPKYLTYEESKTLQSPLSTSSSHGSASPSSSPHASSHSKNVSNYYYKKGEKKEGSQGGPLEKQKKFECYGIYFFLISLAFTVLWGKLFGIMLTSVWLYFFSLWDSCSRHQKRVPSSPRLRQSLHGKDTKNYYMARDSQMSMVTVNLHTTHNRNLHFIRKN